MRDAFRAARTATSAKAAAELAVRKAQEALEKGTFPDASESRAAEVVSYFLIIFFFSSIISCNFFTAC